MIVRTVRLCSLRRIVITSVCVSKTISGEWRRGLQKLHVRDPDIEINS
jgi:hypothetical protein